MDFKALFMPIGVAVSTDQRTANGWVTKTLRIMRLTAFLLLITAIHVSATAFSQNVTLSGKNIPVDRILRIISQQTGYELVYDPAIIEDLPVVTLDVKDVPVSEVLDVCFKGRGLGYSFKNNTIVVMEKAAALRVHLDSAQVVADVPVSDIHGRVTDSAGKPLSGASVYVKGSRKGTSTDVNGMFSLKSVDENATLIISFTGYAERDIKLNGRNTLEVSLSASNSPLDKVQVIAYGNTTQRLSISNVSTVTSKEIEQQPVSNALLALEGQVPGLFIKQSTGVPGSGIKVRVEGQNSLGNGNEPLYVIDGVPYASQTLPTIGYILGGNGGGSADASPLSFINPADIESISVLKDAAATAIYGSRAANGALLITTKKGESGKTSVNINLQNGWSHISRELPFMNTKQYLAMRREAFKNDGLTPGPTDYDLNGTWDTTRYTDWQKVFLGRSAQYTTAVASVSGGNALTQYFVSGTYQKEVSAFPNNFLDQKGTMDLNLTGSSPSQKFHFQVSANYQVDVNLLPTEDLTVHVIKRLSPNAPALYNPDGTVNWALDANGKATFRYNPIAFMTQVDKRTTNNLISHVMLSYQVIPGLELKSSFGYTNQQASEIQTFPLVAYTPDSRSYRQRSANYGDNYLNSWIMEPQISFKQAFGRSRIDALVGATVSQNNANGKSVNGTGYNSDLILQDLSAAAQVTQGYASASIYKYNAAFGRLNYNWGDKYLADLTIRRDGSSRFGSANEFHDFEAIGLGWIFSSEDFIRDHLSFLSFGKLSGSYGTTGNDQIGDYQYLTLYSPTYQGVPYQGATGLVPNGLSNPYLQWESTRKLYVSMNLGFLHDRVILNAGYAHNRSSNQLLGYPLPILDGVGSIAENLPATVQNTSLEFTLKTTNIRTKDFSWTTNINLTVPRNKLVAFPNLANSGYAWQYEIGKPVSGFHTYHLIGVDPATGVFQFMGANGKPTFTPDPSVDQTVLINLDPNFYGGLQNTFRYKGLELDVFFQFVKQKGNAYPFGILPGYFGNGTNQPTYVLNRWQKPGDHAVNQRFSTYQSGSLISAAYNAYGSDYVYSDATYARLKNLSLSYQFPESFMKKAHLKSFQAYVHAQNLLTITKFKGFDPENQSTGSIPPMRVITAGFRMGI